jgi:MFS-type transporter involved in bile tolerance (Atg22 family)
MDKPQWSYALFDAGCWGYASVTVSTLAPLVFVRRIKEAMPVQKFAHEVWETTEREEAAIWNVSVPLPLNLPDASILCPSPHLFVGRFQDARSFA